MFGFRFWLACFYAYIYSISDQHQQNVAVGSYLLSEQSVRSKEFNTSILFD